MKIKLKYKISLPLLLIVFLAISVLFSLTTTAQTVTRGYSSDTLLEKGMLVKLKDDNPKKVEPVNRDQAEKLHGVVINPTDSAVLLGDDDQKVFVASGGPYTALVSDQNGPIKPGDYVTVSSVSGIAMAASDTDKIVIGKAVESFDPNDKNKVRSTAVIKDASGKERTLKISTIKVDISIGRNPTLRSNSSLPVVLKAASETIAGEPVTPTRVYLAFFVFIATAVIAGGMLYSAVRSTMVAIGRNPLGRKAIFKSLVQVASVAVIIFITGLLTVYLILKI